MLWIMDELTLVDLGQRFADARGISLWRVGFLAADDGKFFTRLQTGRTCTLRSARVVVQYLSDHWPDDHEWPADIPRPASRMDNGGKPAAFPAPNASPPVSCVPQAKHSHTQIKIKRNRLT